jgi:hypothetical protein
MGKQSKLAIEQNQLEYEMQSDLGQPKRFSALLHFGTVVKIMPRATTHAESAREGFGRQWEQLRMQQPLATSSCYLYIS